MGPEFGYHFSMVAVTLQEAKARLNRLVDLALEGEAVVLMRGAQIVAMIQPISAEDVEITPHLTDRQAQKFWEEVEREKKSRYTTPASALRTLKRMSKAPKS